MPPKTNWESIETWQRLVVSIVATGVKVDLRETAKYFGATYDTLENRWRKVKKEAKELEGAVERGERGEIATPRKSNKAAATGTPTPRKSGAKKDALGTVTNGRVSKTSPAKKTTKVVKAEESFGGEADIFADLDFGAELAGVSMDVDGEEFL